MSTRFGGVISCSFEGGRHSYNSDVLRLGLNKRKLRRITLLPLKLAALQNFRPIPELLTEKASVFLGGARLKLCLQLFYVVLPSLRPTNMKTICEKVAFLLKF